MLKKIIRVGGVDIEQSSCMVAFNARINMDGNSLVEQSAELTHNKLYKLLETATDVKEVQEANTSKFVTFKHGVVEFEVYARNNK